MTVQIETSRLMILPTTLPLSLEKDNLDIQSQTMLQLLVLFNISAEYLICPILHF